MKSTGAVLCADSTVAAGPAVLERSRLADYVALTKPRIAVLVLFTVAIGVFLASGPAVDGLVVLHAVLGTGLVAAGASALNQLLERRTDARMKRTESRPLPAGRLQPGETLVFGLLLGAGGLAYLTLTMRQPWTPLLAAVSFVLYVGVYTPLKSRTELNTLVGAIPGALPPVIGWTAARGTLDLDAAILFGVVFLWQIPHFLAIAWMYREDYARAGLKMLPVVDPTGRRTCRHMIGFTAALLALTLLPVPLGSAGVAYALGASLLGLWFLGATVQFARGMSRESARAVLRVSLVYLPGVLALLTLLGKG